MKILGIEFFVTIVIGALLMQEQVIIQWHSQRHLYLDPKLLQSLVGVYNVVDKMLKCLGNLGCGLNKFLVMFFFNVIHI
jgi:hypothetical protein